jgi:Ankyrin repeat
LVSLLIKSGADVNVKSNNKVTPLMLARELPVVRLLLDSGAAVDARSADDATGLHKAAERGLSAAVICCLLKAGADATAVNNHGHEPAAVAAKHGHTAAAALLQHAAADQRRVAPAALAAVAAAAEAAASPQAATALTTAAVVAESDATACTTATSASTVNAEHSNEVVKDSAVKHDAATTVTAAAAVWMCTSCKHVGNPIEDTTCQACGVVGNTEQQQREFEAALPQLMARGPDITLPDSFFDGRPTKNSTKGNATAVTAAAALRSVRKGSSKVNSSGSKYLTVKSSSSSSAKTRSYLSSLPGVKAVYTYPATATSVAAKTKAAPDQTEPVRGSWRCIERDLPVRNRYLSKIAQVLATGKSQPDSSTRYSSKVPEAARHLETQLYNSAASFAVYSDDSTWQLRMCEIA